MSAKNLLRNSRCCCSFAFARLQTHTHTAWWSEANTRTSLCFLFFVATIVRAALSPLHISDNCLVLCAIINYTFGFCCCWAATDDQLVDRPTDHRDIASQKYFASEREARARRTRQKEKSNFPWNTKWWEKYLFLSTNFSFNFISLLPCSLSLLLLLVSQASERLEKKENRSYGMRILQTLQFSCVAERKRGTEKRIMYIFWHILLK